MAQSEEFDDVVSGGTAGLDRLREAGLRGMEAVTQARQEGLERERERLAAALGEDHPRVKDLAGRLETGRTRLRALGAERARAVAVAKGGATEWVLHGYVWSADGKPAADLSVALVDRHGQWLRELGFVGTDARGHFELRVPAPAVLEAHVSVSDRNRAPVFRSDDAVNVAPGRVEYREITLGQGGTRGPVPPEDVKTRDDAKSGAEPPTEPEKKPRRRN